MEARAEKKLWSNEIEILLAEEVGSDRYAFGTQVIMETKEHPGLAPRGPTFTLPPKAAQRLMDDMWQCGLRPSEGSGSAGSLAATERHLKDMQRVAFALMKKDGAEV